jgi:hypothetical protein
VDAKLGQSGDAVAQRRRGGQLSPTARPSWAVVVLGLGSMGIGIGASNAVLNSSQSISVNGAVGNSVGNAQFWLVAIIWIVIGIINVAYARRR